MEEAPFEENPAAQSYVASGFNQRLGFGARCAVLIVDMCAAYFANGSPLRLDSSASINGCRQLIDVARAHDMPVMWSRVDFNPEQQGDNVFYRKVGALSCFDSGNPLGDWLDELTPDPEDHVFTKQAASAFFGTDLAEALQSLDVDTVVIGGVSTSGCVRASVVDACQHNFVPVVVAEACGDRTPEIHNANLFDLDAKYGDVISMSEFISHTNSDTA